MLTLLPGKPAPFRAEPAREEMLHIWDGLDRDSQRMAIAYLRALAETRGVPPAKRGGTA